MPLLTPQQTVRFFILGLPIGLILSGIIAMFIYFRVDRVREHNEARVLVSKPLSENDLRSHVRTFAAGIGSRHSGVPETLSSAAKYIQSTLGPANLGFKVSRHEIIDGDQIWYNLIIDVPGAPGPHQGEIVMVTANYDTAPGSPGANANGTGMAALMSLAESFAGSASARSLRFVALVNEAAPWAGTPKSGSAVWAESLKVRQDNVVAVVCLESLGYFTDAANSQQNPAGPATPFPATGQFLALIANARAAALLPKLEAIFVTATKLPLEAESAASAPGLLGTESARTFDAAGLAVLRVTDTGALRDPNHGKTGDTPDRVDYPRLLEAVRGVEAIVRNLLNPGPSGS